MQPKRRQFTDSEELQAWKNVFRTGRDYFHTTEVVGANRNTYHQIDTEHVRAAWKRLGRRYLDELWPVYVRNNPRDTREQPWAVERFGAPE